MVGLSDNGFEQGEPPQAIAITKQVEASWLVPVENRQIGRHGELLILDRCGDKPAHAVVAGR